VNFDFKSIKTKYFYTGLSLFTFFVAMQLTNWLPLRYWGIWGGGDFIDSQQILRWSQCYKIQNDSIFLSYGECSGFIYGSTLVRIISLFNVNPSNVQIFGHSLLLLLAFTISRQVGNFDKLRANPLILFVVLSPPILLLAERANFDILMLALISSSGSLFAKNHHSWALVPLALATLFKFYTLPLFLLYFLLNRSKKSKAITLFTGVAVSVRVILDLMLIQNSFPSGSWAMFGVSIWTRYLADLNMLEQDEATALVSGSIIFLLAFAVTVILLKRLDISFTSRDISDERTRVLFYLFYGTHLSCFCLGMNYDYRLVFFMLSSIIYLYSFVSKREKGYIVVLVSTLLSVWFTYPVPRLSPIGDLTTEIMTVILGIRCVQLLKLDLKKNAF